MAYTRARHSLKKALAKLAPLKPRTRLLLEANKHSRARYGPKKKLSEAEKTELAEQRMRYGKTTKAIKRANPKAMVGEMGSQHLNHRRPERAAQLKRLRKERGHKGARDLILHQYVGYLHNKGAI